MFDAKKLLNELFGAGGANSPLDKIGGAPGGLLNDSVSGVKEGAAAIEQKTGIGAKADAALKSATGKSGGDLFEQGDLLGGHVEGVAVEAFGFRGFRQA